MIDLVALRAAAKAATPGPWLVNDQNDHGDYYVGTKSEHWFVIAERTYQPPSAPANATYIALANPAAITELIDAYERLATFSSGADHTNGCGYLSSWNLDDPDPCDCGLVEARAALTQVPEAR